MPYRYIYIVTKNLYKKDVCKINYQISSYSLFTVGGPFGHFYSVMLRREKQIL
jgi:hypothetical protein